MGFVMPHVTVLVATGVAGLALVFQIVGLATPGWFVIKATSEVSTGLWESCTNFRGATVCITIEKVIALVDLGLEVPAYLHACRAFGILGVLVIAGSVLFGVLICFMSEQKNTFFIAAPVAAGAGALFVLIEFAVYVGEENEASEHLGYSFALTVVAFCLCVGASLLFLVGRSKSAA